MGLTELTLKNAKPQEKRYKISDDKGLYVLILPAGGKYFQFDYRFANKRKTLALGVYPEVSLKEAREKREEARRLITEGIDPSEMRKAKRHNIYTESGNTFGDIALEWHTKNKPRWKEIHANRKWRALESDVIPYLGSRPIKSITTQELLPVIRKIEKRSAIAIAHRTKNIVGEVYAFAIATDRADRNIAIDLKGALAPMISKHRATITDPKKVGELMRSIYSYVGTFVVCCALKISPYVILRPVEVVQAEWGEIDLENKLWKIPAEKMKMARPHIIPLANQVVKVLEELLPITGHGRYVFPSTRSKTQYLGRATINTAIRLMGYSGEEMCAHGFRAMASTLLYENGFEEAEVEMQLAHAQSNKVKAAYNHAKYLPQRIAMMQWWADYLDKLKA